METDGNRAKWLSYRSRSNCRILIDTNSKKPEGGKGIPAEAGIQRRNDDDPRLPIPDPASAPG